MKTSPIKNDTDDDGFDEILITTNDGPVHS